MAKTVKKSVVRKILKKPFKKSTFKLILARIARNQDGFLNETTLDAERLRFAAERVLASMNGKSPKPPEETTVGVREANHETRA